jgi:hypothetical protein
MIPVFIWSIALTLVVRRRQRKMASEPSESLRTNVQESLALVEHQIWWNRKYFWLCTMPGAVAMQVFFTSIAAHAFTEHSWSVLARIGVFSLIFLVGLAIVVVVYGMTYRAIELVVRRSYEPKRQELLTLLASLDGESTNVPSESYPRLMNTWPTLSRKQLFFVCMFFLAFFLFFCVTIIMIFDLLRLHSKG